MLLAGGALPRSQRMSAASWGLSRRVQARRHCSINNTQPNRSQHIPFISSTHFILPPRPPPKYKGGKQGSTTRMKKTPCPLVLRKNPSPSSANPPPFFFFFFFFLHIAFCRFRGGLWEANLVVTIFSFFGLFSSFFLFFGGRANRTEKYIMWNVAFK